MMSTISPGLTGVRCDPTSVDLSNNCTVKELDKKGYPTPEWPWAAYRPKHDDMKDGRSATYDEWLKAARIARIQRIIPQIDELEEIDMGPVDYDVSEAEDGPEDETKGEAKGEAAR